MSDFFVVLDNLNDWSPYYPSQDVITFDDYLQLPANPEGKRVRVINLCRSYKYLSTGYYCALLAEARGHNVFPSVSTINDLERKSLASLQMESLEKVLKAIPETDGETLNFHIWFGETINDAYSTLAGAIFEKFPCPILEVTLEKKKGLWQVEKIKAVSLKALEEPSEEEAFANTFEKFSRRLWKKPKARKSYRFDLAILYDPKEEFPPSDEKALKRFEKAANKLGMDVEFITKKDYFRIPEFDGLFIRETTTVDHHTYRFAKKAEAEGLVVMDDPTSIMRCTNKIYLADLLKTHKVPTPRTLIFSQVNDKQVQMLADEIGFPMVLKIPDGSFSRGVIKVSNPEELEKEAKNLLKNSALLLAQEFLYTEYDWRIGVLNGKAIYACRYYMVRDHWQIYKHEDSKSTAGKWDTLPTFEAPKKVLEVAIKASKLIGNGFYGVDIKQSGDRVVVIEVNDNPSIESAVEDLYLGEQLYLEIMGEFLRRMEARGR